MYRFLLVAGCPRWSDVVSEARKNLPLSLDALIPGKTDPVLEDQHPTLADCSKAESVLGLKFISPVQSAADLLTCPNFQRHIHLVSGKELSPSDRLVLKSQICILLVGFTIQAIQ